MFSELWFVSQDFHFHFKNSADLPEMKQIKFFINVAMGKMSNGV